MLCYVRGHLLFFFFFASAALHLFGQAYFLVICQRKKSDSTLLSFWQVLCYKPSSKLGYAR